MKRIIKILLLLLVPMSLMGQLAPVTNQYILNPLTINPSFAGNRGALNVAAFYRKQWTGIAGSPTTMTLAADAPFLDNKLGLGLILSTDKLGVTRENRINTNYSYKIDLKSGTLSLGLGAGLITTNTAWSDLVVVDPEDQYYLIDSRVFVVPDFSFGAYYTYENYFAGFSIPRLLGYRFDFDENKYALDVNIGKYSYMLNTGYLFNVGPRTKIMPSVLLNLTPGSPFLYDINTHVILYDRLWAGLSYRSNRSVGALFQFAVNEQFRIAYTYDFDFGKLGRYSNGSHEVMLRYEFKYKVEVVNPLIF
ncbi:MAG TPA: type IX secretion system membrane protein PorP/SprF [Bacteroidales bacterium]|nr:type IX secretion system membrane protein PorP/SprF [Bacteroidales bacterium]